jgi:cyclophilin family peptidyl-prolyl cis-trans isomerase/HEAT repeat protein
MMERSIYRRLFFLFKRIVILYFCIVGYFIACSPANKEKIIDELHRLEWKRDITPNCFEPYTAHESEEIRIQIAKSIAHIQNSIHVSTLQKLLNDTSEKVIRNTIFALGQVAGEQAIVLLKGMLFDIEYADYQREIIQALGRTRDRSLIRYLNSALPSLDDSLIVNALRAITFLTPRKSKSKESVLAVKPYLKNKDEAIRTAAVYYFSRNPDYSSIRNLIEVPFERTTIGYKYKLKALDRAFASYNFTGIDSTILDSFKIDLLYMADRRGLSWQTRTHQISLLAYFTDSLVIKKMSEFIRDDNPHLRLKSIQALNRIAHPVAKNILLNYYNVANWLEKGTIINAIAGKDRHLAYRLVQQNLDRGTLHFKKLLLKSLAIINDRAAIRQLRQFLQVPNVRLKLTAFTELAHLKIVRDHEAKMLLQSGDEALVTNAASWIIDRPKNAYLEDLITAYEKFSEPKHVETMLTILEAIDTLNTRTSIEFLTQVYNNTMSKKLADQAKKALLKFDIDVEERLTLRDSLFIPESVLVERDVLHAVIETERGDIKMELWPHAAPLTVTNFVILAQKGYYNNISFHRVVSDFVIQGGDPRGDGWGGPGYRIPCEYNELPFLRGSVGMATAGKDTGGSQFFICHSEQPHLNRQYTLFGKIVEGLDIVDIIEIDDKITKISIQKRGEL